LPAAAPQVVAPVQQALVHNTNQLVFPLPAQPTVVAPAGSMAMNSSLPILAMTGPVVIAPAPDAAQRNASSLQLPAQAPPQVAAPASAIASARTIRELPGSDPQVVPPPPDSGRRDLGALGGLNVLGPGQSPVPPAQPVSAGTSQAQAREIGQLLALNAH